MVTLVQVTAVVAPALDVRIEKHEALNDPLLPRGEEASIPIHHLSVSAVLSLEEFPFLMQPLLWGNKRTTQYNKGLHG